MINECITGEELTPATFMHHVDQMGLIHGSSRYNTQRWRVTRQRCIVASGQQMHNKHHAVLKGLGERSQAGGVAQGSNRSQSESSSAIPSRDTRWRQGVTVVSVAGIKVANLKNTRNVQIHAPE